MTWAHKDETDRFHLLFQELIQSPLKLKERNPWICLAMRAIQNSFTCEQHSVRSFVLQGHEQKSKTEKEMKKCSTHIPKLAFIIPFELHYHFFLYDLQGEE